jgi:hypothetical protein
LLRPGARTSAPRAFVPEPGARSRPENRREAKNADNLLFVGGNVGRLNAEPLGYTGKVGGEVTLEQAYERRGPLR